MPAPTIAPTPRKTAPRTVICVGGDPSVPEGFFGFTGCDDSPEG